MGADRADADHSAVSGRRRAPDRPRSRRRSRPRADEQAERGDHAEALRDALACAVPARQRRRARYRRAGGGEPPSRAAPRAFDERREAAAREFESGEVGEQAGIEPVGLGLDATPGAERRGFIGVHAGERHGCLAQALAKRAFIATARLERHESDAGVVERAEPSLDGLARVVDAARRPAVDGDVDPVKVTSMPMNSLSAWAACLAWAAPTCCGSGPHAGLHSGDGPYFLYVCRRRRRRVRDSHGLKTGGQNRVTPYRPRRRVRGQPQFPWRSSAA